MTNRIDEIATAFMRDFPRDSMIESLAAHDHDIDDFIDAQFDDDFSIIDDDFIMPILTPAERNELRAILITRIFELIA